MIINVQTSKELRIITLIDVAYIFDFMINLVTNNILTNKNLHFDTQYRCLHKNENIVVNVHKIEKHYVLKNNTKFEEMFSTVVRTDSTID